MADRRANDAGAGTRLALFARSLLLLGVIAVGIPWLLVLAAQERFGGASPFHGVASPADWSGSQISGALTDRLTEQTIADVLIRLALVVAWVGVIVVVLTVVAEVVHMVRHDGLALPDVRGLGLSQRTARVIAAGLLVVVPLVTSPSSSVARGNRAPLPDVAVATALAEPDEPSRPDVPGPATITTGTRIATSDGLDQASSASRSGTYVVKAGDSIFGIAERIVGPDTSRVAEFAERLVDINLGREMTDGRRFDNAAFIDVGWELELPEIASSGEPGPPLSTSPITTTADVHVVERGESLWSIAEDELGDPSRWPEVYEANEGRTFDDGRQLTDPDLIQPGWALDLPSRAVGADAVTVESAPIDSSDSAEAAPASTDGSLEVADESTSESVSNPAAASAAGSPGSVADAAQADAADGAGAVAGTTVRSNIWHEADAATAAGPAAEQSDERASSMSIPAPLAIGGAAMLSSGVLALLGVRRRSRLRSAEPRSVLPDPAEGSAATERSLRAIDHGRRADRIDTAIRSVATALVDGGERVESVIAASDGAIEFRATGPVELVAPWGGSGAVWELPASAPTELLADESGPIGTPCPTLVQLGVDRTGREVYVDLEAVGAIEVGGPGAEADSIVAAVAATLAGSVLAEVTTLIGVGVPDDAFLGHRRYVPASDVQSAFASAADALGSTASTAASMSASTFALRVGGTASEAWEPAVVLVGAAVGSVTPPPDRTGLAVVSASPIHGPSSRLAPDGDEWVLLPAGLRFTPVGLTEDELGAVAELVTVTDPVPAPDRSREQGSPLRSAHAGHDDGEDRDVTIVRDLTLVPDLEDAGEVGVPGDAENGETEGDDDAGPTAVIDAGVDPGVVPGAVAVPVHELVVRMIGPVDVVDRIGSSVSFERSKTRELVAWLATHRDHPTRSAARTAMWELDVRDATFANVVSEARRAMARLVEPPDGEEWVGRTMTDSLPLHDLVISDADLIRHALAVAADQPSDAAIETLSPAVDLIAGVPFEGTAYLWPDTEGITSEMVLLATTAATELAEHQLAVGDIEGVFRATGRGLQVLPGHEALIGLRMEAHARAGDHAGVRQEWESYERVINGDPWSDGEPAPKLVELRRRLLDPAS